METTLVTEKIRFFGVCPLLAVTSYLMSAVFLGGGTIRISGTRLSLSISIWRGQVICIFICDELHQVQKEQVDVDFYFYRPGDFFWVSPWSFCHSSKRQKVGRKNHLRLQTDAQCLRAVSTCCFSFSPLGWRNVLDDFSVNPMYDFLN